MGNRSVAGLAGNGDDAAAAASATDGNVILRSLPYDGVIRQHSVLLGVDHSAVAGDLLGDHSGGDDVTLGQQAGFLEQKGNIDLNGPGAFGIGGAPAPDPALGDRAAVGGVRPQALITLVDHIHVAVEHHRAAAAGTLHGAEHVAIAVHLHLVVAQFLHLLLHISGHFALVQRLGVALDQLRSGMDNVVLVLRGDRFQYLVHSFLTFHVL